MALLGALPCLGEAPRGGDVAGASRQLSAHEQWLCRLSSRKVVKCCIASGKHGRAGDDDWRGPLATGMVAGLSPGPSLLPVRWLLVRLNLL